MVVWDLSLSCDRPVDWNNAFHSDTIEQSHILKGEGEWPILTMKLK